ncbi:hypothetical protein LWI29_015584 [Acer saccharum]|uniref:DNA glycosylase n=1 Tax=Acer saccharum TaxID=4024 RepID=A0AA39SE28_ACESA|nr:hypothetical protein LWI29_015584 [Acer saccharum]
MSKVSTNLTSKIARIEAGSEEYMKLDCVGATKHDVNESSFQNNIEDDLHTLNELSAVRSASEGRESYACDRIGNFPSPRELANLDRRFLAKRCGLGYRAGRILKLAQAIVEGRIQLKQLEEICNEASLTSYDKLSEQLSKMDGFGPFTCANVLVCMGFYHVIPSDSGTIRHLKQVHARKSTVKTIQMDVERIYRKYAPYQFLAYWSELWHLYEQRFGKLSKMPYANYKLITASNMITNRSRKVKKSEIPHEIGNLHNLEVLALADNYLVGIIPAPIFNILTLKMLVLGNNTLSGSLPSSNVLGLPNLDLLELPFNNFSGTFPSFITNTSKLQYLEKGGNSFSGFIPNTIGNCLTNLEWLGLAFNYFTSSTPDLSFFTCQIPRI